MGEGTVEMWQEAASKEENGTLSSSSNDTADPYL